MNDIKIVLENGVILPGKSFGYKKIVLGDFIFNTSLVGYQEVLTDPSYFNEVVVMTFPVQGIYGINEKDFESNHSSPSAFIVQEFEKDYSNNHATSSIDEYLKKKKIQGVSNIDTRYLTKIIRDNGSLKGMIVSIDANEDEILKQIKVSKLSGHVANVSSKNIVVKNPKGKKNIVFMDFGKKESILNNFIERGFKVTLVPFDTKYEEIKKINPDFVFLSNGPGDPAELESVVIEIKKMISDDVKISGICLGHQLISIALGAKTTRLKFGHHSINHPVHDLEDNKVYITSQNHNYAVEENTIPSDVMVFMKSLHDNTVEGIKHKTKKIISVQFHPEAGPGPSDANKLFDKFINYLIGGNNA